MIDTNEQLDDFCTQLQGSPWIAVDTEFMREKTYYPKLALVQISNGAITDAIDPLAVDDLEPLRKLMFNHNIIKIFHAARQDMELFYNLWGALPAPVFDTQLAASPLGHGEQIGYARLVQIILDVELAKGHSRTDWMKRPLSDGQIRYALDDVIYLAQAYEKMHQTLSESERLHWLDEEFALLTDTATYTIAPEDLWQKVKGKQHLKGIKLAVLQQLAIWRELQAENRDLPRRWILKDEVMIDLSRRMPDGAQQLGDIRGLEPAHIKRIGTDLIAQIQKGQQVQKADWPREKNIPKRLNAEQEAMVDYLGCALRIIAEENQTSAAAIASKKDLATLVQGGAGALSSGWRYSLAGAVLSNLSKGKRKIDNQDGKLSIVAS